VLAALGDNWGWAPLVRNLGGLFYARASMSDDDIPLHAMYGPNHFAMDEAFCARMRMAIAAGLENAPNGVITTPGTKKPRYVLAEPRWPLASPLVDMDF
jgi:hypothetical protein